MLCHQDVLNEKKTSEYSFGMILNLFTPSHLCERNVLNAHSTECLGVNNIMPGQVEDARSRRAHPPSGPMKAKIMVDRKPAGGAAGFG